MKKIITGVVIFSLMVMTFTACQKDTVKKLNNDTSVH